MTRVADDMSTKRPGVPGEMNGRREARPRDEEVAARLRLALMRLSRRLRQQTVGDLSPSLLSALASIECHGPVTLGQLAALERVQPPSVTRLVAGLEKGGLVVRDVDPGDRRFSRVAVTAEGRRVLRRSRTRKAAYLARHLRELSDAELSTLRDAVDVFERLLEGDR